MDDWEDEELPLVNSKVLPESNWEDEDVDEDDDEPAQQTQDVASSVHAIANEKLKAEKGAMAGKKKGVKKKKKQLYLDQPDDDLVISAHEYADDYDLM